MTENERSELEKLAFQPEKDQIFSLRARIVMACAKRWTNITVAKKLGIASTTVGKWRQRFIDNRIAGLHGGPCLV